jgi:predicted secreted hydrolase
MVLASQASLLVEASVIPHSGSSTVETEAYMRVTGYSWKSNEYGLTVDSVTKFHLVSPNGTEIVVTEANEDLWFALKVCLMDGEGVSPLLTRTTGGIQ